MVTEDERTPEEIEEERRARIAALAAPSRLQPMGDVRPRQPIGTGRSVDAEAPRLTRAGSDNLSAGDLSEAPRLKPASSDEQSQGDLAQTRLKPLSFHERQALPTIGSGVEAGSQGEYISQKARLADQRQNPWGSAENHPGRLGKVGHVLARIGNVAGDIVAPETMAMIPGTDINKGLQDERSTVNLEKAKAADVAQEGEKNRAKHEENVENSNDLKYKQDQEKIDETADKNKSQREIGLRRVGLSLNDKNEPVPLTYENMSPIEKAHFDLQSSMADYKDAQAEFERTKGDPNSEANKNARQRLTTAAKNAATNAGRLGLSREEFSAKYLGVDPEGNQLSGTKIDPNTGKPIGPSVANSGAQALAHFNKDYVKPSEDTERAYQMYQDAMKAYNSGDTKTGAATMMALAQHIGTTFGQTKGSKQTRDLINDHKNAIGIIDKIERFGNHLLRGDELSASQMKEFGDLIGNFRKLSWQTAVKEGKRANQDIDFLPPDLQREFGAVTQPRPNAAAHSGGDEEAPPVNLLKEGTPTTFKNGEVWTLKQGKQVKLK